jgi:hypothetical protein
MIAHFEKCRRRMYALRSGDHARQRTAEDFTKRFQRGLVSRGSDDPLYEKARACSCAGGCHRALRLGVCWNAGRRGANRNRWNSSALDGLGRRIRFDRSVGHEKKRLNARSIRARFPIGNLYRFEL